jgi:uncharacterized protein (TIGR00369 family)
VPGDFEGFLSGIPIARSLGFALASEDEERVALRMPVDERALQIEGRVHGGLIATLADTAAVWLLHRDLPSDCWMTGIEFTLHFLRPALPGPSDLLASARAVRRGRTVSVVDVEVDQAGKLVAKGLFTYLIRPRT